MLFFPEGTFGRAPGLRPFRMGAFVVAAQTGVDGLDTLVETVAVSVASGRWSRLKL